jgi:hypothetical protein
MTPIAAVNTDQAGVGWGGVVVQVPWDEFGDLGLIRWKGVVHSNAPLGPLLAVGLVLSAYGPSVAEVRDRGGRFPFRWRRPELITPNQRRSGLNANLS